MSRIAGLIFAFLIFSIAAVAARDPQYRGGAQEECPQGRQIRAQKAYPSTMNDCEVLDADTTAQNKRATQRPGAVSSSKSTPSAYPIVATTQSQPGPVDAPMIYEQAAVSPCTSFLRALGTPGFAVTSQTIIDFVYTRTDGLGSGENIVDFVATECRLHDNLMVGQAIENLFDQQKQNRLPRIPIGGATDSPEVRASWEAFDKWVHHQGPRPDFRLVAVSEHDPAEPAKSFTDHLKSPFTQTSTSAWVFLVGLLGLYFAPALIAANRGHHNTVAISALNLFLGWSFLGWVAAFVWACTQTTPRLPIDPGDVLVTRREPLM
jgi:hypothetical protein